MKCCYCGFIHGKPIVETYIESLSKSKNPVITRKCRKCGKHLAITRAMMGELVCYEYEEYEKQRQKNYRESKKEDMK